VLGNPVTAVAWLARKVDSFGVRLKAGDIVLPGRAPGDRRTPGESFVADFTGLGSVRLSFE
jgi:2-keto-4-pentenoate hydratase